MTNLTRTYLCPECGYDGFRMGELKVSGFHDVNFMPGCPACLTIRAKTVWLVETSDPRSIADGETE